METNETYENQVLEILLEGTPIPVYRLTPITHRFAVCISSLRANGYVIDTQRVKNFKDNKAHFTYQLLAHPTEKQSNNAEKTADFKTIPLF